MDPAVLSFSAEDETIEMFNGRLKGLIQRFTNVSAWSQAKFESNIGHVYGGATIWGHPRYGRRRQNVNEYVPTIARPQGS